MTCICTPYYVPSLYPKDLKGRPRQYVIDSKPHYTVVGG